MERGSGSEAVDKSQVLNVKPLRCLVPIFPSQPGMSSSGPQGSPFTCVPPTGPFPPGVAPFYPFFISTETQNRPQQTPQTPFQSPVPINSFRTPNAQSQYSGATNGRVSRRRQEAANEDGEGDSSYENDVGYSTGRRKGKAKSKKIGGNMATITDTDIEALVDEILPTCGLIGLDILHRDDGDKEAVSRMLLAYNLLRRRINQIEDSREAIPGNTRRPDLRAGALLMKRGVRTNCKKRIGVVPGVDVGDIFFFRMEMCLVGLHAPSMSGIDYMTVKLTDDEPLAVSIVSSGGYEDDGGDGDVLIYSGQGGVYRKDKLLIDQKLERGNLALEKSLHRANEVRVIRGIRDLTTVTGKVYVYDGLYQIHESWVEKGKADCNVFKYKLVRVPGQPPVYTIWKSMQQWKDGVASRPGVILPDLTSGAEILPVSLVNDVDDEKGPAYFTYIPTLKYGKPFTSSTPSLSCNCQGGCQPVNSNCPCVKRNDGFLPYTSQSVLLSYNSVIHECGPSCSCPSTCRNRVSQAGLKVRLEVFKTRDRGWGLRSSDPIRAGSFICEFAGEVIDASNARNDDSYIFDATRVYDPFEYASADSVGTEKSPYPLVVSAQNVGNVARFMNHSCAPNVYWQPVLRESNNEVFLHIAFFAIRHIPLMQELVYDYGRVQGDRADQRKKKCLCGSSKCKGYFY